MKPDGPWVSLPSKTYLDKVYYFNVLTGASTWEKPPNYCEPVHDSTILQYTTVSGNPENIEPCSYIVESLSPTSSPRKHVSQNKSGEEESKNKNQKHVFRLPRERNKMSHHPYKNVGRAGLSKDDDFTKCPYNKERITDVSCMVQKHIEPTSKNANFKASSNTDSVTLEMKRAGSSEPKLNLSNSKIRSGPGNKGIDRNRDRKTFKPTFFNNRDELRAELKTSKLPSSASFKWDTKPPLVSGVFGSASLRLERLKKQLAEDRLKKNQQPFTGKPNMTMSKKSESYDVSKNLSRNSAEYLNVPSNYNESLRKSVQTSGRDCENKETVKISWEHHPKRLVQDYDHKRLSSSFVEKSSSLNHVNTSEPSKKYAKSSLDCEAPVKRETGLSNSSYKSDISVLFKRRSNHEREFLSCDESGNQGRKESSSSSFKTSEKLENVAKGICRKDSQDHLVTTKQGTNSCYNISSPPKALKVSRSEVGNPRFFENLPEKVQKQKYHNSKGGITKINRRVQKQIRIVAPKYIQLTSDLQKRLCDLPENNYSAREILKSPSIPESDQGEEMDWEPIEPEKVVLHVEELRREGALQNYINPELINLCNNDSKMSSQWFIVLDTNIFISNLEFLKELRDMKDKELGMPSLIVPWVVLQELDNLKSSTRKVALQLYARKAIQFLHVNLSLKHPRIRGQPKAEAEKHSDLQPDDSILQCSLDLQKQSSKVLLLTNDRNLFNKAVINGLECCSAAKLLQELENRNTVFAPSTFEGETKHTLYSIIQTLKQCIGHLLEEVLRTEMVIAYDRQWSKIIARKPPWSLNDILFCILKHWVAVFNSALPAEARELIEKLRSFVNNEVYEYSSENVENILKTCVSLVHLVSSLAYKQYVDEALKTLCELQCVLNEQKKLHAGDSLSTSDSTSSKLDYTASATSNSLHSSVSSSRVLEMKGEQHSHIGSGLQSNEDCDGSICCGGGGGCGAGGGDGGGGGAGAGAAAKCDADDDCLSLFASSFSEDTSINQEAQDKIKAGQELVHKCLNTIWEEVVVYCGILCDMMGINPCVVYRRPDPFPSLEKMKQNLLSYISCVRSLLRCMDGILAKQPDELQENSPELSNFYTTIKDFLPVGNNLGEILLPEHLLVYCTQKTRQQLECGKKQFEQFEAVLNRALTFFLVPNQDNF